MDRYIIHINSSKLNINIVNSKFIEHCSSDKLPKIEKFLVKWYWIYLLKIEFYIYKETNKNLN